MSRKSKPNLANFRSWVSANGGEILSPTNPYEVARFKAGAETHVIYERSSGRVSFSSMKSAEIYMAWREGKVIRLNPKLSKYIGGAPIVRTLIDRDGPECFFCGVEFSDEIPPTIEHLVARTHNGPDHISNKFLCCGECNKEVGHLSAPEKIRMRDRKRFKPVPAVNPTKKPASSSEIG